MLSMGTERRVDSAPLSPHISKLTQNPWQKRMYAIIRSGDKQFRAEPGMTVKVPSLQANPGDTVTFDQVLVAGTDEGVQVGLPTVSGATVTAEVVRHGKARKVIIFKWKRRKNYRKKQGHRQGYTEVRIGEIRL